MPDRDWEKELAEIDRRLAATPTEPGVAPPPAGRAPVKARPAPAPVAAPSRDAGLATPAPVAARRHWKATAGLLVRLVITAVLLAGVVIWPYETRCGPWLAGYLATIGVTALSAVWTSVASWRHRGALIHVLSLGMLVTAAVYGAIEVLPRVGYALPDPAHPAMWACR
jgi:hypothetical protein